MWDSQGKATIPVSCPKCGAIISVFRGENVKIEAQVIGQSASEVAEVVSHILQNDKREMSNKNTVSLLGQQTNMNKPKIFISYSNRDKDFVRGLVSRLERDSIETWFDEVEIKIGESIHQKINEGLKQSDFFAIVLSKASVESRWVQEELSSASSMEKYSKSGIFVLPILMEKCEVPPLLLDRRYANFKDDYDAAYSELVDAIYYHFKDKHPETDVAMIAPPTIDTSFRHEAKMHPEKLYEISPRQFEELVASIFVNHFGYKTELTPMTRDGGYDIILFRDRAPGLSPEKTIVQCKRYRAPIGVSIVRELAGTLTKAGVHSGILVTTSSFTQAAKEEAKGQRIDLIDGVTLSKWLETTSTVQKASSEKPKNDQNEKNS